MAAKEYARKMIELDADGNLSNQSDWSEEVAKALATEERIGGLTERHWIVLNYMRKEFQAKGDASSIRKLTK